MKSEGMQVRLVTNRNPQSQLFVDYIHAQLDCQVSTMAPSDTIDDIESKQVLVLLDVDHVDETTVRRWLAQASENQGIILAAFNLRDEDHAAEIMIAQHLQGIFYRSDSLENICKGISKLFEGELWMSRPLMTRLISFYRRLHLNAYRPACGLTQREIEIIFLIGSGASNPEIASKLFVSEHTVKTHLYNIFRKIKVRNRIQAMNWAHKNLGVPSQLSDTAKQKKKVDEA